MKDTPTPDTSQDELRKNILALAEEAHPVKRLTCDQVHAQYDVYHPGDHSVQYAILNIQGLVNYIQANYLPRKDVVAVLEPDAFHCHACEEERCYRNDGKISIRNQLGLDANGESE